MGKLTPTYILILPLTFNCCKAIWVSINIYSATTAEVVMHIAGCVGWGRPCLCVPLPQGLPRKQRPEDRVVATGTSDLSANTTVIYPTFRESMARYEFLWKSLTTWKMNKDDGSAVKGDFVHAKMTSQISSQKSKRGWSVDRLKSIGMYIAHTFIDCLRCMFCSSSQERAK